MPLETDVLQNKGLEQFIARIILFSPQSLLNVRLKRGKYKFYLNWSYLK